MNDKPVMSNKLDVLITLLDQICEPETKDEIYNAGWDLKSRIDTIIPAEERKIIPLGISTSFSNAYVGLLEDRSGLAAKNGLTKLAGVIDSNYRGEWGAVIYNSGSEPFYVKKGDRICQVLFVPIGKPVFHFVDSLPTSERGENGFGSSGI